MSQAAHKHPALFALHGTPAADEEARLDPWVRALARVPAGPDKEALAELVGLMQRHPVRIWGAKRAGETWVVGMEADPRWRARHPELFRQALAAWRRALGPLLQWCQDLLMPAAGGAGS